MMSFSQKHDQTGRQFVVPFDIVQGLRRTNPDLESRCLFPHSNSTRSKGKPLFLGYQNACSREKRYTAQKDIVCDNNAQFHYLRMLVRKRIDTRI